MLFSQTLADVAKSEKLTWLGIDFSEARFINFGSELTPGALQTTYIPEWSRPNINENNSKNIRKAYRKDELIINNITANERNAKTNYTGRIVTEGYDLNINKIREIINEYKLPTLGYSVLLVVEGFDKKVNNGYIWVVFINNADSKIIAARRFICDTKPFGDFDNRWNSAIDRAIFLSGKYLRPQK